MSQQGVELTPRSVGELVVATFGLYRRYPLLFLVLAAAVIVPYQVIVLIWTGTGSLTQGSLGFGTSALLTLADLALVTPLVSALHVHVVAADRVGETARAGPVSRWGLRALPAVALASVVSWLGICLGFFVLIAPGVLLMLRWAVVAQAAALERGGWRAALRRSADLSDGHYRHVFLFFACVFVLTGVPVFLLGLLFGEATTVLSFLVGLAAQIITWSFAALATALLYFDLVARLGSRPPAAPVELQRPAAPAEQANRSWDPRAYSDRDRPQGWYVDPEAPHRMRYWGAGAAQGWSGKARTPGKIQGAWEEAVGG